VKTRVKEIASCHDPKIIIGVFKGFVNRALKICSSIYIQEELEFLVNVFIENGYKESELRKVIKETKSKSSKSNEEPHKNSSLTDDNPTITLPWIPGVSPKLKKVYKKDSQPGTVNPVCTRFNANVRTCHHT